ncbi:hypothetical protein SERLA73DRAFT_98668 [Serpula lacrymans var. lacrymans S7.3]|uniref:Uncharacterized protein n=2 Tax=Serpula lacrymans var. lacrymans TaxID=341189 RepID=F8QFP8_SERL3|nr:uncharacterized protein SERLADRAFT_433678 [Serpula lacrymans var. lacrymans S7.9]EGN92882.1 hypothetical protein SERLA73DRAFT_98668 [Serpula lacrymans var. lacrymans S7.3]EGO29712.1 hypothetical protein SERLADRAFT_433678 [Serpula lacrymans var. lacrymans S7.9]
MARMHAKPRLHLDPIAAGSLPPSSYTLAVEHYPHVSSFRSLQMEMQLYSPSVKTARQEGSDKVKTRPVFGDLDRVEGKVILDSSCSQSGRLSISIEGVFEYTSAQTEVSEDYYYQQKQKNGKHRHVFLSSLAVVPMSPPPDNSPRGALREAFAVRKRPSVNNLNAASRSCEFSFEIPRGSRPGEDMPPTFSASTLVEHVQRKRAFVEKAEVSYRVTAVWEATDGSENRTFLEAPILFQPDTDFQSLDGLSMDPECWLEMPLKADRPIPFQCALTLPSPNSFPRASSIPYFVVFTTTPRSPSLAREIAADATIVVSLIRQVTITHQSPSMPPTPPDTPPLSDDSDNQSPGSRTGNRLLRRVARLDQPVTVRMPRTPEEPFAAAIRYKPLPNIPKESFSESRTIHTEVFIGFPKRPRNRQDPRSQPSQESHAALPDGLFKGKIQLCKDMLPGVDWPGLSVKYYLDVSVLFGQDDLRARFPIRVY